LEELALEGGQTEFQRTHADSKLTFLKFRFAECPVTISLGVLGKKWALVVLRDIGIYNKNRFNLLLKSLPGISPRVLATRLNQLEEAGLITRISNKKSYPMKVRWALTEKGIDIVPIIMMFAAYGSKYFPDVVFHDKRPRKLHELLDEEGMDLMNQFF
jgi:DNA-binding HxlR family transcriptional regulator